MRKMQAVFLLLACAGVVGPAFAEMPKVDNGRWVDGQGRTLYMFDKDANGKSACNDACTTNWPRATADSYDKASGDWSIVKTEDGAHQWAYKGHPLYRFMKDKKMGDAMGDGLRGMWHVAKP